MEERTILQPDKEDMDLLQLEVDEGGYFGWFGTKKYSENKALLKAELWQTQKEKTELKYKICVIYIIEDPKTFKEAYVAGAFFENNGTLFEGLIDKMKEVNISSAMPFVNTFMNNSQS